MMEVHVLIVSLDFHSQELSALLLVIWVITPLLRSAPLSSVGVLKSCSVSLAILHVRPAQVGPPALLAQLAPSWIPTEIASQAAHPITCTMTQ